MTYLDNDQIFKIAQFKKLRSFQNFKIWKIKKNYNLKNSEI